MEHGLTFGGDGCADNPGHTAKHGSSQFLNDHTAVSLWTLNVLLLHGYRLYELFISLR